MDDASTTPTTEEIGLEPSLGLTARTDNTAMPTENVDAAEPRASVINDPKGNVSFGDSSLTSSESDGDDHRLVSTVETEAMVEQYTSDPPMLESEDQQVQGSVEEEFDRDIEQA